MRIAWFSPVPVERLKGIKKLPRDFAHYPASRSCYVSDLLLPLLARDLDIEVFHNGGACTAEWDDTVIPVFNYLNAARRAEQKPFDVYFYQVEDSPVSGFCRHHLGVKPGVVWFHSGLFQTRAPDPLSHSPWEVLIDSVSEHEVPLPDKDVWPETNDPYPHREVALALACMFSQEWAHGECTRNSRRTLAGGLAKRLGIQTDFKRPSCYLGLPVECGITTDSGTRTAVKKLLFIGAAGAESRYHKLFRVVEELNSSIGITWLVFEDSLQHARDITNLYPQLLITVEALPKPVDFTSEVIGYDAVVFGQYSLFDYSSPWLEIAVAQDVPVLVSDFGVMEYKSPALVSKMNCGKYETRDLKTFLEKPHLVEGRKQDLSEHDPSEIAMELLLFLRSHESLWRQFRSAWEEVEAAGLLQVEKQLRALRSGG